MKRIIGKKDRWHIDLVRGPVKIIKTNSDTIFYNHLGQIVKVESINSDSKTKSSAIYNYSNGLLMGIHEENGDLEAQEYIKKSFIYDKRGDIVKYTEETSQLFNSNNYQRNLTIEINYSYNELNQLIARHFISHYLSSKKEGKPYENITKESNDFRYNKSGTIIRSRGEDSNGASKLYLFDKNDNLVEKIKMPHSRDFNSIMGEGTNHYPGEKETYKYDLFGNVIESCLYKEYKPDYNILNKIYDDDCDNITTLGGEGKSSGKTDYYYKYDKYGNWIEYGDAVLQRIIEYYE